MNEIVKYSEKEIIKFNTELPAQKHPQLGGQVLAFVCRINTSLNLDTSQDVIAVITSDLIEYFQQNKINRMFTFQEFCNITKGEILKKGALKLNSPLFISSFESWMKENKYFKSAAIIQAQKYEYTPPQVDWEKVYHDFLAEFRAGKMKEFDIEFRLPNIYPYMRKNGLIKFSEVQKKSILGDNYISEERAIRAVNSIDKPVIIQFNKNKGWLVFEQFKLMKNV